MSHSGKKKKKEFDFYPMTNAIKHVEYMTRVQDLSCGHRSLALQKLSKVKDSEDKNCLEQYK